MLIALMLPTNRTEKRGSVHWQLPLLCGVGDRKFMSHIHGSWTPAESRDKSVCKFLHDVKAKGQADGKNESHIKSSL